MAIHRHANCSISLEHFRIRTYIFDELLNKVYATSQDNAYPVSICGKIFIVNDLIENHLELHLWKKNYIALGSMENGLREKHLFDYERSHFIIKVLTQEKYPFSANFPMCFSAVKLKMDQRRDTSVIILVYFCA